jgi:hypothetical protein
LIDLRTVRRVPREDAQVGDNHTQPSLAADYRVPWSLFHNDDRRVARTESGNLRG